MLREHEKHDKSARTLEAVLDGDLGAQQTRPIGDSGVQWKDDAEAGRRQRRAVEGTGRYWRPGEDSGVQSGEGW